jgi:hypothetical protein
MVIVGGTRLALEWDAGPDVPEGTFAAAPARIISHREVELYVQVV